MLSSILFLSVHYWMDSFDKNMSTAFDDIELSIDGRVLKAIARLLERDTDSQSMFNNSGVFSL